MLQKKNLKQQNDKNEMYFFQGTITTWHKPTFIYLIGLIGGARLPINLRPLCGDCHGVGHKYSSGHDGHRHGIGRGFAFSPGIVVMVMVLVMNKVEATTSGNKEMTLGYHVKLLSLV